MMLRHALRLLLGCALSALALPAQPRPAAYARAPRDTLRYHELTTASIVLRSAQGEVTVSSEQDAVIAFAFARGDSARAWYESLLLSASSPQGTQSPPTEALLRQPFHLRVTARGRLTLLQAPAVPSGVAAITDLAHQFDDFFMRLPAGALALGRAWSDTSVVGDSTGPAWYRARSVAHYAVRHDTVVNGVSAVVIAMTQELTLSSGGPVAGQPVSTAQRLAGRDSGEVVFAPAAGRMLTRVRRGTLTGTLTVRAATGDTVLPQTYGFESRIEPAP
ncbi:MAG: hypothetical protein HY275_16860 [Gemmatimonadetes bacterium]|nr:hypothetical protein [Gemmatimonadota bacterium]